MSALMEKLKAIPPAINQRLEQYEPTIRLAYRLVIVVAALQVTNAVSRSQTPDVRDVASGLAEISKSLESIKRAIIIK